MILLIRYFSQPQNQSFHFFVKITKRIIALLNSKVIKKSLHIVFFLERFHQVSLTSMAGCHLPPLIQSVIESGTVHAAGGYGGGVAPGTDQASSGDTSMRSVILSLLMFHTMLSVASDNGPS